MSDHARCAAQLRSGERCRSVAVDGSEFRAPHRNLAADVGDEALRAGRHTRRRRQDSPLIRIIAEPTRDDVERPARNGNGGNDVAPSDVRPRLAAAAAANLPELERVLLDAATGATREPWTTVTCKFCERQGRYKVVIPDYRVRLDAVEKLLQQGLGRAREAKGAPVSHVPAVAADVLKLSWQDLQRFAATFCLDDLVAVQLRGTDALLRERVAALSEGERRVLRAALDPHAA